MHKTLTLTKTKGISRDEWLDWRRKGIGSSDAPIVAGLSPWKSPLALYLDKIGEVPEPEVESEWLECGTLLEDDVAELFERRTGMKPKARYAILQSAEHPFMLANLDRTLPPRNGDGPGILECKTAGITKRGDWEEDRAPLAAIVQVQHQLAVTGYSWAYLAVLLGGNRFLYTLVERDQELIDNLIEQEAAFWQRVLDRNPPEPDGSESSTEALKRMYPESVPGAEVILPPTARGLIERLGFAKEREKSAAENVALIENELRALMGEAEIAYLPGVEKPVATWKTQTARRWDTKALEAARPELAPLYKTESVSRRFTVKGL